LAVVGRVVSRVPTKMTDNIDQGLGGGRGPACGAANNTDFTWVLYHSSAS